MSLPRPRFVTVPYLIHLKDKSLKYKDLLTYAALISFYNTWEGLCFPSYSTIAARAGCSRLFIIESISRLQNAGLITVKKLVERNVSNHYKFTEFDNFVTIPFLLFSQKNLTANEKAMLIAIRQFFSGDTHLCIFNDPIKQMAKNLGLTYKTVYTQYKSLVKKGYITDKTVLVKELFQTRKVTLSIKLNWTFKPELPNSIYDTYSMDISKRLFSF